MAVKLTKPEMINQQVGWCGAVSYTHLDVYKRQFQACVDGTLDQIELEFEDNAAVCVVLASAGYPEHYEKGYKDVYKRQAVYNAIIHSNYAALVPIQIRIHEDAVYISNDCVLSLIHISYPPYAKGKLYLDSMEGEPVALICEADKGHC